MCGGVERNGGERMTCKYPNCSRNATVHWALVPLCHLHRAVIEMETQRYYNGTARMRYEQRVEYLKIAHLIPWSQVVMGRASE